LANIATAMGLEVNGFTSLAVFVMDAVSERLKSEFVNTSTSEFLELKHEILTLTSTSEMGDIFKVMELTKNIEPDNSGFNFSDQVHRLYVGL